MKTLLRLAAIFLFVVSLRHAYAGLFLFPGEQDPAFLWAQGKSLWASSDHAGRKERLEKADMHFRKLNEIIPQYGRPWVYRAMIKAETAELWECFCA